MASGGAGIVAIDMHSPTFFSIVGDDDILYFDYRQIDVLTSFGTIQRYIGNFYYEYDAALDELFLVDGELTEVEAYSQQNEQIQDHLWTFRDLSIGVEDWATHVIAGDAAGIREFAFRGDDLIGGSNSNDVLFGFAGNDRFLGYGDDDVIDGGAGIDTAVFASLRANYQITKANGQITVSGPANQDGTDTLVNIEYLEFADGTFAANVAPSVNVANLAPAKGAGFLAGASLFSVVDIDDAAMSRYRFFDGTAGNGHFTLNGVKQVELSNIEIAAADLANFRYVMSATGAGDTLWVQAYDGFDWSSWKSFTVAAPMNVAPVAVVQNLAPAKGTAFIAGSGLLSVTDPDDAAVARYRFFDGTAGNGRFQLNGVNQAELANIEINAADLANFGFATSATGTGDVLWVQAYDGFDWGAWKTFTVAARQNNAPVVTVANIAPAVGTTSISAQTLFAVADADQDTITQYRFFDGTAGNGHFVVNGVSQAELQNLTVDAADLANTAFAVSTRPGTSDTLWVQAYDGTAWSAWKSFTVSDSAPQVRFSVTIEDPQNQLGAYHNAVSSTLQAAANLWSDHLAGDAHLEIRVRFFDANNSNRASGQSAVGVNIGSHAGNVLFEEGTQYEIRTGIDPNGSNADIEITATEDYIKNFLWFDPNPSSRTAPVPLNRNDAVSIFVHELGHALGFNGWIGSAPGFESEYDSHIVTSGGHRFFTGANATALYGGAVPLTDNNGTHVGNASPLPGSDLADDTMGGVVAKFGVRTAPTALNLAILNDLGVAIKAGTAQRDVLSVIDSNGGTIDGRGGDDLLRGGSGNDTLIGGAGSDTIGFSGARSDYVITKANGTITVADQRAGSGDGTDTLSEVEFLQFNDGTIAANRGPVVAVSNLIPGRAVTTIAAADLFSVSDPDGDAMAQYRFFDGTAGNGRFELNGIAQAALQNITIDADDLANFRFRPGTSGSDVLWVQVSDGLIWSDWKTFTVTAPANIAPVINVQGLMPAKTESFIAGSALFTVTDPDDASMAKYRFFDGTAGNGRFQLNATNQAELANIEIDASDLANFRYLTSTTGTGDTLWVQAYDGFAWSTWKSFTVTAPVNIAPIVSVANLNPSKSATFIAGASLFTVTDPDDANMVKYRFFDGTAGNGRLTLGGAQQVELANIEINAADLANFGYTVSGTGAGDTLWVQAYDGFAWSAWKSFTVAAPVNAAPVVNASDMSTVLSVISAGTLFTITDPDDASMVRYRLFDGTIGGGRFQWDGVNQVENQNITVEATDLADFDFVVGTSDVLWVQAFDGFAWSAWKSFTVTALSGGGGGSVSFGGSVVTNISFTEDFFLEDGSQFIVMDEPTELTVAAGAVLTAASFLPTADAEGNPFLEYQFDDRTPGGGTLRIGGVAQPDNQIIHVMAGQLAATDFMSASAAATDMFEVRAFDGTSWGAWNTYNITTLAPT